MPEPKDMLEEVSKLILSWAMSDKTTEDLAKSIVKLYDEEVINPTVKLIAETAKKGRKKNV